MQKEKGNQVFIRDEEDVRDRIHNNKNKRLEKTEVIYYTGLEREKETSKMGVCTAIVGMLLCKTTELEKETNLSSQCSDGDN